MIAKKNPAKFKKPSQIKMMGLIIIIIFMSKPKRFSISSDEIEKKLLLEIAVKWRKIFLLLKVTKNITEHLHW